MNVDSPAESDFEYPGYSDGVDSDVEMSDDLNEENEAAYSTRRFIQTSHAPASALVPRSRTRARTSARRAHARVREAHYAAYIDSLVCPALLYNATLRTYSTRRRDPPTHFSVSDNAIALLTSDGDASRRPPAARIVTVPDFDGGRRVAQFTLLGADDPSHVYWRDTIAKYLAAAAFGLASKGGIEWSLVDFPANYALYRRQVPRPNRPNRVRAAPSSRIRDDIYLYGSATIFSSPAEFVLHALWLLHGAPPGQCWCKYCYRNPDNSHGKQDVITSVLDDMHEAALASGRGPRAGVELEGPGEERVPARDLRRKAQEEKNATAKTAALVTTAAPVRTTAPAANVLSSATTAAAASRANISTSSADPSARAGASASSLSKPPAGARDAQPVAHASTIHSSAHVSTPPRTPAASTSSRLPTASSSASTSLNPPSRPATSSSRPAASSNQRHQHSTAFASAPAPYSYEFFRNLIKNPPPSGSQANGRGLPPAPPRPSS